MARSDGPIDINKLKHKERERKSKTNKRRKQRKNKTSESCGMVSDSLTNTLLEPEGDVRARMGKAKKYLKK